MRKMKKNYSTPNARQICLAASQGAIMTSPIMIYRPDYGGYIGDEWED